VIQADGRANHTVDVYVGNSFDITVGMVPGAPTSLTVPSGEVCLPASETPTPTPGEPGLEGPPAPGTEPTAEEPAAEEPAEPGAEEPPAEEPAAEEPASSEPPVLGPPAPEVPQ